MAHRDPSEPRVGPAIERSFLAGLPHEAQERLLADSVLLDVPAGSVFYRDEDAPRTGLLVAGLVRVYLTSAEGRQVTVRYARTGDALGVPTAIGGPVPVSAQAITGSGILILNSASIRALAVADPHVAWSVAEEVTRLLYAVLDAFSGNVFGSVRQRLAGHLLDLAAEHQRDALLVAPVNQQALADAVGTAREVVARTLHDLRGAGLVESDKRGIILLDPDRLQQTAATGDL